MASLLRELGGVDSRASGPATFLLVDGLRSVQRGTERMFNSSARHNVSAWSRCRGPRVVGADGSTGRALGLPERPPGPCRGNPHHADAGRRDDVAAIMECSIELPDGNILYNGSFHMAQLATGAPIPVVGGTGAYSGLRGTVVMTMATPASTPPSRST